MNVLSKFFRYGEEFICFTIALCILYAKIGYQSDISKCF